MKYFSGKKCYKIIILIKDICYKIVQFINSLLIFAELKNY